MSTNGGSALRDHKSRCVADGRLPRDKRLSGMTALVTGASRGIGKGIALALANAGCEVAVADIADPKLTDRVVSEIEAAGGSAFAIRADVRSFIDVHRMFDDVVNRFSKLDV